MIETAPPRRAPTQPRAEGEVRVSAAVAGGRTRLARLYQRGSAKCLLPRGEATLTAVLLNTAGGITGGDRFAWSAEAGPGAELTVSTQAAERAYRAQPGETGAVRARLTLGAGARLDWLSQETILYDGSALDRRVEVEMARDAHLILLEPVILGRIAMGERLRAAAFHDSREIRREGRRLRSEATRLDGPVEQIAARPAVLGDNRAFATILAVGPDFEAKLPAVRAVLPNRRAGASHLDDCLAIRLAAPDGACLRSDLKRILGVLRDRPLPRVWTM